jgi:hypothetical protein
MVVFSPATPKDDERIRALIEDEQTGYAFVHLAR